MMADNVLSRFDGVKRAGAGYSARCPAHHDREASLTITPSADKVLIHCHAGCAPEAVLGAVGLKLADLYNRPTANGRSKTPANGMVQANGSATRATLKPGSASDDPLSWWASYCGVPLDFVRSLPLETRAGDLVFSYPGDVAKVRKAGTKEITWQPGGATCPPIWPTPPGTLPATIWLTEGESDCTVGRYVGLDTFAMTKGCEGVLSPQQARSLKQRGVSEVIVVYDADDAGRKGTAKLANALRQGGLAVNSVDLTAGGLVDPLAGQKDLRDAWRSVQDRDELRRRLEAAAGDHHHLHPGRGDDGDEGGPLDLGALPEPAPLRFVVPGFLPEGYPTNLYADSGQGKSYLAMCLGLSIVTGQPFLGRPVVRGPVLYLDWELDAGLQRLRLGEVARGMGLPTPPAGFYYRQMAGSLADNVEAVRLWQQAINPVATILDSVGKAAGDDPLDHAATIRFYSEVGTLGTALLIDHQPKPAGETAYSARWEFGSSYKRHYARCSWQLERVGGQDGVIGLVLRHKKTNFGPLEPDLNATLTFDDTEGVKAVRLEPAETADAVSRPAFGLRARILGSLRDAPKTAKALEEAIPDASGGSIRNEVTALKRAGLVVERGKDGNAPIYAVATSSSPSYPYNKAKVMKADGQGPDDGETPGPAGPVKGDWCNVLNADGTLAHPDPIQVVRIEEGVDGRRLACFEPSEVEPFAWPAENCDVFRAA